MLVAAAVRPFGPEPIITRSYSVFILEEFDPKEIPVLGDENRGAIDSFSFFNQNLILASIVTSSIVRNRNSVLPSTGIRLLRIRFWYI